MLTLHQRKVAAQHGLYRCAHAWLADYPQMALADAAATARMTNERLHPEWGPPEWWDALEAAVLEILTIENDLAVRFRSA